MMDGDCLCDRLSASVVCHHCGYRLKNCRIHKTCPVHPTATGLDIDIVECPNCNADARSLIEYRPGSSRRGSRTLLLDLRQQIRRLADENRRLNEELRAVRRRAVVQPSSSYRFVCLLTSLTLGIVVGRFLLLGKRH